MNTVLIMIGIFWVLNFKTRHYFFIFYYTNVYLRLSMYDCSNFVSEEEMSFTKKIQKKKMYIDIFSIFIKSDKMLRFLGVEMVNQ
jgi:hypothetical protein